MISQKGLGQRTTRSFTNYPHEPQSLAQAGISTENATTHCYIQEKTEKNICQNQNSPNGKEQLQEVLPSVTNA